MTDASFETMDGGPLSWEEARTRLRKVLQEYLEDAASSSASQHRVSPQQEREHDPTGAEAGEASAEDGDEDPPHLHVSVRLSSRRKQTGANPEYYDGDENGGDRSVVQDFDGVDQPRELHRNERFRERERRSSLASWWIRNDLDLYVSALSLSVALLILSCLFLSQSSASTSDRNSGSPPASFLRAQVAGAALFVVGSVGSLALIRRRRHLALNDSDSAKRREILRFIRNYDAETAEEVEQSAGAATNRNIVVDSENDRAPEPRIFPSPGPSQDLPGTSLTDIYPVFRAGHAADGAGPATRSWCRIPSLLLVKGDWVALQVGDTVPADCEPVVGWGISATKGVKYRRGQTIALEGGRVLGGAPVDSGGRVNLSKDQDRLPKGRVTLPVGSDQLLTLCNGMNIYRVVSPPLQSFIRRPAAESRPSQTARKILEVRKALSVACFVFLSATVVIVFSREGTGRFQDLAIVVPVPFLAALGLSPVMGPAFLFALEMLGTARIMQRVHPYAARSLESRRDLSTPLSQTRLLFRYLIATLLTRLSLWEWARRWHELRVWLGLTVRRTSLRHPLVRIPPASLNLLEKLGVATALALVDDELACDPHALPQQLLIPSAKGLKLLDLCPTFDDDDEGTDDESHEQLVAESGGGRRGNSFGDSDDENDSSEDGTTVQNYSALRRKFLNRRRKMKKRRKAIGEEDTIDDSDASSIDVQFEDPTWWQHLPSLKCIGLAGLVIDEVKERLLTRIKIDANKVSVTQETNVLESATSSLLNLICSDRGNHPLRTLAECIGFSTESNSFGGRGDLSPFTERLRLRILSRSLLKERLERDSHERSSEQSRWWGLLRPDATSVIVRDSRSGAHQLLTVGDPAVVLSLCNEAWQGEISTIIPLGHDTRRTVMETSNSWKLGDLDVAAFSYSPVPLTIESQIVGDKKGPTERYLLDYHTDLGSATIRDKSASQEWAIIRNQVFLGILGSLLVPRREITDLLRVLNEAGVRFTYFSPRNMRRQKELASQMGIDVAWNCAISLRPLESGAEDEYRMVSNYADWDVNARLPHGIADVRKHLKEVDNVPLLVSLFTDVTKKSTREMVEIFQEYNDTVIAIGISHLPRNDNIFSTADIAVGIDLLTEPASAQSSPGEASWTCFEPARTVRPSELEFVCAISSHSCAFRFHGASSLSNLASILATSRASLESATAATVFVAVSCVSFSGFVLLSSCIPSTSIVPVPILGSVLFVQILVPLVGLSIAMGDPEPDCMKRVPPKNDLAIKFARKEGLRLYGCAVAKAVPVALFPQLLYLIVLGEFFLHLEPSLAAESCPGASTWAQVIRCPELRAYSGVARTSAGAVSLAHFALNVMVGSASFVSRFSPIRELAPWQHNHVWAGTSAVAVALIAAYMAATIPRGSGSFLPWYYFAYAILAPFLCLAWNELWKRNEAWHDRRAEKLRRLQFETRLGAWSPK